MFKHLIEINCKLTLFLSIVLKLTLRKREKHAYYQKRILVSKNNFIYESYELAITDP